MRSRVNCPNNNRYKYYGGRGIALCKEWNDFMVFHNWAIDHGYNDTLTIDRIDGDGNYEPGNCRWVSPRVNNQNKKKKDDCGIYPKKNGFYVQIIVDGVYYCGGYSTDINESRRFKEELLLRIKGGETDPRTIISRKKLGRNKKTGRFIWI